MTPGGGEEAKLPPVENHWSTLRSKIFSPVFVSRSFIVSTLCLAL